MFVSGLWCDGRNEATAFRFLLDQMQADFTEN